jgi:hypothetical protein
MDVGFTINLHDSSGHVWDKCLLLHFDESLILRLKGVDDLDDVIKQLKKIKKEIIENY